VYSPQALRLLAVPLGLFDATVRRRDAAGDRPGVQRVSRRHSHVNDRWDSVALPASGDLAYLEQHLSLEI
jgi:hypothetical protein